MANLRFARGRSKDPGATPRTTITFLPLQRHPKAPAGFTPRFESERCLNRPIGEAHHNEGRVRGGLLSSSREVAPMSLAGLGRSLAVAAGVSALVGALLLPSAQRGLAQTPATPPIWTVPEIGALPNDAYGQQVRRGRDLVTATYAHIGPNVPDPAKRFAGNNLACSNCHLNAGTKKFGIPLFGLFEMFPQYSARSGAEISIEDRLNGCMLRSMNGKALPVDGPEMAAFVAYIKFL